MDKKVYGYARVSTKHQSISRQIDNLKKVDSSIIIFQEAYTGTKMDRPIWNKLMKIVKEGDTIVFDEVSRMSRDAEEGFEAYKDLYNRGISLQFIKESTLNTDNFRNASTKSIEVNVSTGSKPIDEFVSGNLELINNLLLGLAEEQIQSAFMTAQHEVDFLHQRTSEGVLRAKAEGKQIGPKKGSKLITKKSIEAKKKIREYSKDFDGSLSDGDVIKLVGISRNSYYKYKGEMLVAN